MVRVEPVLVMSSKTCVLVNVTELTLQFAFMSGDGRVDPAKMMSAVPSFATAETGLQFGVFVQWSLPAPPFHVHVVPGLGMTVARNAPTPARRR
jgi:hypothetical protein